MNVAATVAHNGPLIEIKNLSKMFAVANGTRASSSQNVFAVQDVTFDVARGEVVAIVGESGSGKTTVGRSILRLTDPTAGEIWYDGVNITRLGRRELLPYRRRMQMIFQSALASLNPRKTIADSVAEAFEIHGLSSGRTETYALVAELLDRVGISTSQMHRYPHTLSGGQCQRVGIARALAVDPEFVIADEPVSALDVCIQAQILNLLNDLKDDLSLTVLFVSHDLGVVRHISDRIVVMYLGRVMEIAPTEQLFTKPAHPYTQALIGAAPIPSRKVKQPGALLQGEIPSPLNPPSGCVFRTRCARASDECSRYVPTPVQIGRAHTVACLKV